MPVMQPVMMPAIPLATPPVIQPATPPAIRPVIPLVSVEEGIDGCKFQPARLDR